MTAQPRRSVLRFPVYILLSMLVLCVVLAALSALSNLTLPPPPADLTALTDLDRARTAEALHLKQSLGDSVWPGWGSKDIPLVVFNDEYAFLIGLESPPLGWEQVEGTRIDGQPVFRRPTRDEQNFTAEVASGVWAGTIRPKWAMDVGLRDQFHEMLPAPLGDIIPYRLLILPSEAYIGGLLHETFHAFQAMTARDRFDDSDAAYTDEAQYQAVYGSMQEAWRGEVDLLIQATEADSDETAVAKVREFLAARERRRAGVKLAPTLVLYEQRIEWLEGLAKYVEINSWEAALQSGDYAPLREMEGDPDFQAYKTFDQRWSSEMISMRNAANNVGDGLFYYTGMAQSRLLDRLMPGWKDRIFGEGVWLDDLLAEAVAG